jgi:protein-disulfide isomerase
MTRKTDRQLQLARLALGRLTSALLCLLILPAFTACRDKAVPVTAAPAKVSDSLPVLGKSDARHVLVEYFDYPCGSCRVMAGFLDSLRRKHPENIAVRVMPVPLDPACNRHAANHPGSCQTARLALAVWRLRPDLFADFHAAVMNEPEPGAARALAESLIDPAELAGAMAHPDIDRQLRENIATWRQLSTGTEKLPKLILRGSRVLHGLPSSEADFIRVMEQELGLAPEAETQQK